MISKKLHVFILIADLAWIVTALLIVSNFWITGPATPDLATPSMALACVCGASLMLWSVLYSWLKLDGFQRGWSLTSMSSWLLVGVLMLGAVLNGALFPMIGRLALFATTCSALLFLAGFVLVRMSVRLIFCGCVWGTNVRRMVILGDCRIGRELAAKIDEHPEMRTQVVGFLSGRDGIGSQRDTAEPRRISTLQIIDLLKGKSVTDLAIVLAQSPSREVIRLASLCRNAGISVSLVPEYYDLYVNLPTLFDIGGVPLLRLEQPIAPKWCLACKSAMDKVLVVMFGTALAPVLAAAGMYLHFRQGRIFESEIRCGRDGKHFSLYRFAVTASAPSNRWFLNMLEYMSFTELPQLWNVLRGDMSLVGPRPETPDRILRYSDWHQRRLAVKPGITGWAQVHGLRNGDSSDEKTRFDLHYILNWSPLLDCVILLLTVWTLLNRLRIWLADNGHRADRSAGYGAKSCSLVEPPC
jgi:lipopolysaccharide/colanic/teichoic acid biosynthesis glycosyltransferase